MVRLSRLTDYGLVLMSCFARRAEQSHTARDLANESGLPLPTVSKVLKVLLRNGMLVSHRGIKGGYSLARRPREISLAEIIAALEGPVALTDCSGPHSGLCEFEACCSIKRNQQVINQVVRGVMENVTLADLVQPLKVTRVKGSEGRLISIVGLAAGRTQ